MIPGLGENQEELRAGWIHRPIPHDGWCGMAGSGMAGVLLLHHGLGRLALLGRHVADGGGPGDTGGLLGGGVDGVRRGRD